MYEDDDNVPKKESYESLKNTVIYYTYVGESSILICCRNCYIPKELECSVPYGTVLCSPSIHIKTDVLYSTWFLLTFLSDEMYMMNTLFNEFEVKTSIHAAERDL